MSLVERTPEEAALIKELLEGKDTALPFTSNALQVVTKRYLLRDASGKLLETPEDMFRRVANGLASVETQYGASEEQVSQFADQFYSVMSNFEFTPAGRTLTNTGAPTPLVANCIVLHIEDTMESIFGTLSDAAMLQKAGSGLGFPLHLMRPAGTATKASLGQASGPISFLHVYNTAFGVIKQQNRHGANMGVMSVDHPDILEFIHCKDREGDLKNFNVSVGLTDRFMEAVSTRDPSPWMCEFNGERMLPREIVRDSNFAFVEAKPVQLTACELFSHIVDSAWKTGEPGCVFLDTVNKHNPLPGLGRIEACNPCGEQFLHDGDVCNLGSINLEKFVTDDNKVDFARLREVVRVATRMLDNVIDLSSFPVERVNKTFRDNRRIGLGIFGFADMLYQMKVAYNSAAGRQVARDVMKFITEQSCQMSEELAEQKGVFPNFEKSWWAERGRKQRNVATTTCAPTGTIGMMFNVSGGVEPYFSLAYYYKGILGGDIQLSYVNKWLKKALVDANCYSEEILAEIIKRGSLQNVAGIPDDVKRVFVTSMDCTAEAHTLMQAAFQEFTDNAISKTINFPNSATREDILNGYILAWKGGCKGCTVYRDGSRFLQVLNLNDDDEADAAADVEQKSTEAVIDAALAKMDTLGDDEESLIGSKRAGDAQTIVGLQKRRVQAEPSAADLLKSGICPDCTAKLVFQEGCNLCNGCGFSACSK